MSTAILDYQNLRTFFRMLYETFYVRIIPFFTDFCRWMFLPSGTAIREGLDKLALDPTFTTDAFNRIIEFLANSWFGNLSIAEIMLGSGITIYATYVIAKFILDIIF